MQPVRVRGRLSVLAGAPASGKTTVMDTVRAFLPGVVVMDMDDFLEPAGRLARADLTTAAERWPAYDELVLRLVTAVTASGVDCLLLSPLSPHQVDRAANWAVLDCADDTRRARLRRRGMEPAAIEDAVADAAALRNLRRISSDGTVTETAAAIANWVTARDSRGRPADPA